MLSVSWPVIGLFFLRSCFSALLLVPFVSPRICSFRLCFCASWVLRLSASSKAVLERAFVRSDCEKMIFETISIWKITVYSRDSKCLFSRLRRNYWFLNLKYSDLNFQIYDISTLLRLLLNKFWTSKCDET